MRPAPSSTLTAMASFLSLHHLQVLSSQPLSRSQKHQFEGLHTCTQVPVDVVAIASDAHIAN